jgi:hypothetical protein
LEPASSSLLLLFSTHGRSCFKLAIFSLFSSHFQLGDCHNTLLVLLYRFSTCCLSNWLVARRFASRRRLARGFCLLLVSVLLCLILPCFPPEKSAFFTYTLVINLFNQCRDSFKIMLVVHLKDKGSRFNTSLVDYLKRVNEKDDSWVSSPCIFILFFVIRSERSVPVWLVPVGTVFLRGSWLPYIYRVFFSCY